MNNAQVIPKPPVHPKVPLTRYLRDGSPGICPICGSSMWWKKWFWGPTKCIQPECWFESNWCVDEQRFI